MRKLYALSFAVLIGDLIIGCASTIPPWYPKPASDANYFLAANTAVSRDMQLAVDKAAVGGRTEVARQVEVKVMGLQKKFDEEVGLPKDGQLLTQFTQASKTVVSTSLSGSRIMEQKIVKEGDGWRAYVLVGYPIGAASEALMKQISKNNNMYTRFRSSEVFKEMDEEVKKYEEFKKSQQGME
jgi:hypothetical protein